MSVEDIANEDMLIEFTNPPTGIPPTVPPDAAYLGDQPIDLVKIVPTLSSKNKANGKMVGTAGITITWTAAGCAFASPTYTFVAGVGSIVASATKSRAEGLPVLRLGDAGTCTGGWTLTASPFTAVVCNCKARISDAGQTKAKAQ